jgi:hypothetical protein
MKTTVEIPDQLFHDAKAAAAKRRTTLKALLTHALEREVYPADSTATADFEVGEDGLPYLPASDISSDTETVYRLLDEDSDY